MLPLGGLFFPHDDTSTPLASYSAVQLFAQRARQQHADFSLSAHAQLVQRICRRVEGMPLALELAATWLRVMSAEQIAAELETGLTLLTTSLRNVPQRHRSLAAVFAQSWDLLSPGEQSVLMQLAIFRGGFDLPAATQVAGASLATLAGLATSRSSGCTRVIAMICTNCCASTPSSSSTPLVLPQRRVPPTASTTCAS